MIELKKISDPIKRRVSEANLESSVKCQGFLPENFWTAFRRSRKFPRNPSNAFRNGWFLLANFYQLAGTSSCYQFVISSLRISYPQVVHDSNAINNLAKEKTTSSEFEVSSLVITFHRKVSSQERSQTREFVTLKLICELNFDCRWLIYFRVFNNFWSFLWFITFYVRFYCSLLKHSDHTNRFSVKMVTFRLSSNFKSFKFETIWKSQSH